MKPVLRIKDLQLSVVEACCKTQDTQSAFRVSAFSIDLAVRPRNLNAVTDLPRVYGFIRSVIHKNFYGCAVVFCGKLPVRSSGVKVKQSVFETPIQLIVDAITRQLGALGLEVIAFEAVPDTRADMVNIVSVSGSYNLIFGHKYSYTVYSKQQLVASSKRNPPSTVEFSSSQQVRPETQLLPYLTAKYPESLMTVTLNEDKFEIEYQEN